MAGKIAITPRSLSGAGHPALSMLTERGYEIVYPAPGMTPTEEDLLRAVPGCIGWLAGVEPISPRVLAAAEHHQRVVVRHAFRQRIAAMGEAQVDLGARLGKCRADLAEVGVVEVLHHEDAHQGSTRR